MFPIYEIAICSIEVLLSSRVWGRVGKIVVVFNQMSLEINDEYYIIR
jgi:hypothetical protein